MDGDSNGACCIDSFIAQDEKELTLLGSTWTRKGKLPGRRYRKPCETIGMPEGRHPKMQARFTFSSVKPEAADSITATPCEATGPSQVLC